MRHFIKKKNENISNPDWGKFGHNWLLMYENIYRPNVDYEKAAERLFDGLESGFGEVFVLCERKMCRITPGNDFRVDDHPYAV